MPTLMRNAGSLFSPAQQYKHWTRSYSRTAAAVKNTPARPSHFWSSTKTTAGTQRAYSDRTPHCCVCCCSCKEETRRSRQPGAAWSACLCALRCASPFPHTHAWSTVSRPMVNARSTPWSTSGQTSRIQLLLHHNLAGAVTRR